MITSAKNVWVCRFFSCWKEKSTNYMTPPKIIWLNVGRDACERKRSGTPAAQRGNENYRARSRREKKKGNKDEEEKNLPRVTRTALKRSSLIGIIFFVLCITVLVRRERERCRVGLYGPVRARGLITGLRPAPHLDTGKRTLSYTMCALNTNRNAARARIVI